MSSGHDSNRIIKSSPPLRVQLKVELKRSVSCVLFSSSMLSATGKAYTMLHQNEWCYSGFTPSKATEEEGDYVCKVTQLYLLVPIQLR